MAERRCTMRGGKRARAFHPLRQDFRRPDDAARRLEVRPGLVVVERLVDVDGRRILVDLVEVVGVGRGLVLEQVEAVASRLLARAAHVLGHRREEVVSSNYVLWIERPCQLACSLHGYHISPRVPLVLGLPDQPPSLRTLVVVEPGNQRVILQVEELPTCG